MFKKKRYKILNLIIASGLAWNQLNLAIPIAYALETNLATEINNKIINQEIENSYDIVGNEVVEGLNDTVTNDTAEEPNNTVTNETVEESNDAVINETVEESNNAVINETAEEPNDTVTNETVEESNNTLTNETVEESNDTVINEIIEESNDTATDEVVIVQFNCYGTCSNTEFSVYNQPKESATKVSEFNYLYMNDAQYLDETEDYFKIYYHGVYGWVKKVEVFDGYVLTAEPRTEPILKTASIDSNNIVVDALFVNSYLENSISQRGVVARSSINLEEIIENSQTPKEAVLPTIYTVQSGDLLVCYTTAADDRESNRYCISLSEAPNYLNEGGTYYSYDGIYFHSALSSLSTDGSEAINKSNPNYNYFQYLPIRAASNYTTEDFIKYLNHVGYTQAFTNSDKSTIGAVATKPDTDGNYPITYNTVTINGVKKQKCTYSNKVWLSATGGKCVSTDRSMLFDSLESYKSYEYNRGINSILEFTWAIHESGYGTSAISIFKNNFFGMGAYDSCASKCAFVYSNPAEGINAHIDQFAYRYSHPLDWRYYGSHVGDGVSGMNVKYASDKQWGAKIASILYNIDKFLGQKDYNYYTLGVVENSTGLVITDNPSNNSTVLYNAVSGGNTWTANYPVLIVGEQGDYYKIKTDVPVKSDYKKYSTATDRLYSKTALGVEYDWDSEKNITYGYIKKSYVNYLNQPTQKYRDPKDTTNYTQWKTYSSFISHFYKVIHQRQPDVEGLNYWVNRLISNSISVGQLVREFVESSEFQSNNYSDEQYVEIMYQLVHRRSADVSGKQYWLNKLSKGVTRDYILVGFINSAEFRSLCNEYGVTYSQITYKNIIDQYEDITEFVRNFYLKAHQREVDFDGLTYWVTQLATKNISGQQFALEIFMSSEMLGRKLSNDAYVTRVYQSILMRDPDSSGKQYWVNRLKDGTNRKDLIIEFTYSTEYSKICSKLGIELR